MDVSGEGGMTLAAVARFLPLPNIKRAGSGDPTQPYRPAAEERHRAGMIEGGQSAEDLRVLLERCAHKDEKAFATLYRASAPKLFHVARYITRREDWAEEVLQESFVNVWHGAGTYDPRKGAPMTWMTAIVRNRALDWLRKPREEEMNEACCEALASLPSEEPGPDELLDRLMNAGRLSICLHGLGDQQRQAIILAYVYGLSHGEISLKLGCPLGTAKTWIRRGMGRLRVCLEGQENAG
jgi:RNA polymerase sigma-70 factor, ECF subfamily